MDEGEKPFATSRDLKYLKNYSSLGVKKSTRARRAAIAAIFPLCAGINFKTEKKLFIASDSVRSARVNQQFRFAPVFVCTITHTNLI